MDSKPKTAWVVDDEEDHRMALKDALEYKGFIVHEFDSANAAIDALTKQPKPDVIVTDFNTKTTNNGVDLIKAATLMGIKSILRTADADYYKISKEAKDAGATEVFQKPGNIGQIISKVQEIAANLDKEPVPIYR